jgi:hypothetical protein
LSRRAWVYFPSSGTGTYVDPVAEEIDSLKAVVIGKGLALFPVKRKRKEKIGQITCMQFEQETYLRELTAGNTYSIL